MIEAITTVKSKDIAQLQSELKDLNYDLKAKDERINKLTANEGELRGIIKGKDDLINTLEENILFLQNQLDALRHCNTHEKHFQSVGDT